MTDRETSYKLRKRAVAKRFTQLMTFDLMNSISPKDEMYKYYFNAYNCSDVILQSGNKFQSAYCNTRHCIVCGRIRTAKGINGYFPQMSKYDGKFYMLTLTKVSVSAKHIRSTFDEMYSDWRQFNKNWNKKNHKVVGIRKMECNYNPEKRTYNPHYHIVVNSLEFANELRSYWLAKDAKLNEAAQDIRPVKKGGENLKEVFKYAVKPLNHKSSTAYQTHLIYKALRGVKMIYPFGGLKKVSEDVAAEQQENAEDFRECQWNFDKYCIDWINEDGEMLHRLKIRKKEKRKVEHWVLKQKSIIEHNRTQIQKNSTANKVLENRDLYKTKISKPLKTFGPLF
jgi:hypothetical protein